MPGVVAAYQPVGAPSDVEALFNIGAWQRMVGNYNAVPGVAPTWSARTGWTFTAAFTTYLATGITPIILGGYSTWSVLIHFRGSPASGQMLFGCGLAGALASNAWKLQPNVSNTAHFYHNGGRTGPAPLKTSGVMGMSSQAGYFYGINDATVTGGSFVTAYPVYIGAINTATGAAEYLTGAIQDVAIYNRPLSTAEMWQASLQMRYCDVNPAWNVWAPRRRYYIAAAPAAAGRVGIYGARATIALPGGVSIRAIGGNT